MEIKTVTITKHALQTVNTEFEFLKEHASPSFAYKFRDGFIEKVDALGQNYLTFPECRFLPTKTKLYRNIIWKNYLIVYKVLKLNVLVLGVFHAKQNPKKLKSYRRIH